MSKKRNAKYTYSSLGASSHSEKERHTEDYYSTDPSAIKILHKHKLLDKNVPYWETACGNGNFSN